MFICYVSTLLPRCPGRERGITSGSPSERAKPAGQQDGKNPVFLFYSEDSPGIKVGPVPVLVMSLCYIVSVFLLHFWGKYTRSA
ncbi:unnamed protein product [Echinostoma caproni]|uniref:Protein transport protein Sec61 subunit beta n=1 Tax=Echinostoma caproni TaxID=27848 RepID=A0A183BCZ4_9TREM|nr:unnamed protein product [Echinostoma caproni]